MFFQNKIWIFHDQETQLHMCAIQSSKNLWDSLQISKFPFLLIQNLFYLAITSDVVHKQIHSKQIFEQNLTLHIQQFQTI